MKKILLVGVAVLMLTGCVSTSPKQPVTVQPSLSKMRNLVDTTGKELPVRIAIRFGDDQAKATVIVGHGSAGVTPTHYGDVAGWGRHPYPFKTDGQLNGMIDRHNSKLTATLAAGR